MAKQIVVDSLREYKERKDRLEYDFTIASKLGYSSEVVRINNDLKWVKTIIDLINDIEKEK